MTAVLPQQRVEFDQHGAGVSWAALLQQAVIKPGYIHEAYSRFHNYSLGAACLQGAKTVRKDDGSEQDEEFVFTHFIYKAHCYHESV